MNELLFQKGEKVVVKEEYRNFVKEIYSKALFNQQKIKLGLAASKGVELIVKDSDKIRITLENRQIAPYEILLLEPKFFESAEEEIDVSEFFE